MQALEVTGRALAENAIHDERIQKLCEHARNIGFDEEVIASAVRQIQSHGMKPDLKAFAGMCHTATTAGKRIEDDARRLGRSGKGRSQFESMLAERCFGAKR